jgi:hypothetical protein
MSNPVHDQRARARLGRWALASALILLTGTVIPSQQTSALGPVIAASVDEVTLPFLRLGATVLNTTVSGRGEVVAFHDRDRNLTGAPQLDVAGADPVTSGFGATVSADGCAVVRAQASGFTTYENAIAFRLVNRCTGADYDIAYANADYDRRAPIALSYDGRFALVQVEPFFVIGFTRSQSIAALPAVADGGSADAALQQTPAVLNPAQRTVYRIDTATFEARAMPPYPAPTLVLPTAVFGLDISDDGNVVVATMSPIFDRVPSQEAVVWDVAANTSTVVSNPTGTFGITVYPSVSADGRFVSFATTRPLVGGEVGNGPWVYVHDRATGGYVRVSAGNDPAYFSSLSGDGSQVAFGVGPRGCQYNMVTPDELRDSCPTGRIDVAFGPTPGFTTPFQVETVSLDVNNRVAGFHGYPNLSRNGRWIAWVSTAGNALLGQNRAVLTGFQAFTRRRDPGLTVDALNFGPLLAGTSVTGATVVRNTGRTSVILDRLEVGGAGFTLLGGGTCVSGQFLTPGATCTMNVRYTAAGTPGPANGTVLAGEIDHDALIATNALTGQSTVTPPTPGQPTTTTTTVPGQILLDIDPPLVDFGPVAVGIGTPIRTVTVSNQGNRAVQLTTSLSGAHPDDFFVATNGCNAISLQPGQSCTMDVLMVALAGGNRTAVLSAEVPAVGNVEATLQGQGRFSPRLLASPAAITERGLTTIIGQGFPSDQPVTVVVGTSGLVFTVQPDAQGMFRIPLAAFPSLRLGSYIVRVDPRAEVYELVQTALVVQLPTFQPQGPGGPAFGDSVLVTRGG